MVPPAERPWNFRPSCPLWKTGSKPPASGADALGLAMLWHRAGTALPTATRSQDGNPDSGCPPGRPQPPREALSSWWTHLWENKGMKMSMKKAAAWLRQFILMLLIQFQHN